MTQLALQIDSIFEEIAQISLKASQSMSQELKKRFGAYYTPAALSEHMVNLVNFTGGKIGDFGAGSGILSGLTAARHLHQRTNKSCHIEVFEIQSNIQKYLQQTMSALALEAKSLRKQDAFSYQIGSDFLALAQQLLAQPYGQLDASIINPPYFKIARDSNINHLFFESLGFRCPNIYIVFVILSLHTLKKGGTLTALVPRSFLSGRYFKPAREYIKSIANIESITRFRKRSNLFKGDNVLQENCVIKLTRDSQNKNIKVYTCTDPNLPPESIMDIESELLLGSKTQSFILPADQNELGAYQTVSQYPFSLSDLGLKMFTGKVVEHRTDALNSMGDGAQYIEAKCMDTSSDTYKYQFSARNHGNALSITDDTERLLIQSQNMVLIKRISSNSDAKRMHCTAFFQETAKTDSVALSNTIQYIAGIGRPAPKQLIQNLTTYLQSEEVELAIRAISGTTQINVDDMENIRFPSWVRRATHE